MFRLWITLINWRLITNKLAFDYKNGLNKLAFDYKNGLNKLAFDR